MPTVGMRSAAETRVRFGRHRFQHDREGPGPLQRLRVGQQFRPGVAAALDPARAAQHVDALRGQPEVPHHRDAGPGQRLDLRQHPPAAFQLDRLRAALLEVAHRAGQRGLRSGLVAAERQVGHDQRRPGPAHHRLDHRNQLVHGHRQRVGVAQHQLGAGVADQQRAHPGLLEHPGRERVVAGEHGPSLAPVGGRLEVTDGDPPVIRPCRRSGHDSSLLVATTVVGARHHPCEPGESWPDRPRPLSSCRPTGNEFEVEISAGELDAD